MSKSNENDDLIDVDGLTEEKGVKASDSEPNETKVSNQTEKKPEEGGNSNQNDSKPEEGEKSKRSEQKPEEGGSELPYLRVIPKLKRKRIKQIVYDRLGDIDNTEPHHQYFSTESIDWCQGNLHSDVNNQNTEVNFGAKKISLPPIKRASMRNVMVLGKENLTVCDVIERTFPASHFNNFWTTKNDESGNRRLNGIAAHLYDPTGEPMIRLVMTHFVWRAKVHLEGMIDAAQESTEPLSFDEMRRTLPMGTLPPLIDNFVSSTRMLYMSMSERVMQDNKLSINEEVNDLTHQYFNTQIKSEFQKLSTRTWDELTIHEVSLMVKLNSNESAAENDTMALMGFRWKHMCGIYHITTPMDREFKNVRSILLKHFNGVVDPDIYQPLLNGSATRPAEEFFDLNYTGMGIFKKVEDACWSATGQTTALLESAYKDLEQMWKRIDKDKVGLASELKKMYGQATLVQVINNKLVKSSENWSNVPMDGWKFTRVCISVLTIYKHMFKNTHDICSKFPSTVGDAYKVLRTWFLEACTQLEKADEVEIPMRESALMALLLEKADKLQLEHQYQHLDTVAGEDMTLDSTSTIDDNNSVSSLGMSDQTDQVSSSTDTRTTKKRPRKSVTKKPKTKKIKEKTSVEYGQDPRLEHIPMQPKQAQELKIFSPRGFCHLPQQGNRVWNSHKCWACMQKGGDKAHLPWYCPNICFAIIYDKIKTYIPKTVRTHVSEVRGSPISLSELERFVDRDYLKKMTKVWKDKPEPDALRSGQTFTTEALAKAKESWVKMQKRIEDDNKSQSSTSRTSGSSSHAKRPKRKETYASVCSDKSSDEDPEDDPSSDSDKSSVEDESSDDE